MHGPLSFVNSAPFLGDHMIQATVLIISFFETFIFYSFKKRIYNKLKEDNSIKQKREIIKIIIFNLKADIGGAWLETDSVMGRQPEVCLSWASLDFTSYRANPLWQIVRVHIFWNKAARNDKNDFKNEWN